MSLTSVLGFIIISIFVVTIKLVSDSLNEGNILKAIISILFFVVFVLLVYFGLLRLIDAM